MLVSVPWHVLEPLCVKVVGITIAKEQEICSSNGTDGIVEGLASEAKVLLEHDEEFEIEECLFKLRVTGTTTKVGIENVRTIETVG